MVELLQEMVHKQQISFRDAALFEHDNCAELTEADILKRIGDTYGVEFVDLTDFSADPTLLSRYPARLLSHYTILPLRSVDTGTELAVTSLLDTDGVDALKQISNDHFIVKLCSSDQINRELKSKLGVGADTLDSMDEDDSIQILESLNESSVDLDENAHDASIIRFVNQIFTDAIHQRTTDIHMEPFEDELVIRYRIDGVLHDVSVPGQLKRYQSAIVSRVKIMSNLDIAEKRLPQDGRIKLKIDGIEIDVRVSVIPMLHGEAVVMRLLRQDGSAKSLDEIHMGKETERLFRTLLSQPHGIILVTGPTGSGKTTTLYSSLQEINDSSTKIITIEDPVEYQIKGINQIQVVEKAGMTFGRGLRAILRHDPDVVLIGEIRDQETARIAIQASLTGHLVFSTLHTNDSPSAATRLIDMGIEPYLVASSLEGVLAQRLVRVLCPDCKKPISKVLIEKEKGIDLSDLKTDTLYEPVGCQHCRNTGYHGRQAVFELMLVNDEIRRMVMAEESAGEIRKAARRNGWISLNEDGKRLVETGLTTLEEVMRVTKDVRD